MVWRVFRWVVGGDAEMDIGAAVLFLASDDSRYVTGQTINLDGGQVMF